MNVDKKVLNMKHDVVNKNKIQISHDFKNVDKNEICAYIENESKYEKNKIVYDRMGGRPSMKIKINGFWKNCLLDTGARMNVVDDEVIRSWSGIRRIMSVDTISCANGSALKTKGKVILDIEIGDIKKEIEFIVAEGLLPNIIAGIEFLNKFGIRLKKEGLNDISEYDETIKYGTLCSIEARFGEKVTDNSRFTKAVETLKLDKESDLYNIISKNRSIFMANKWDIGRTDLIRHSIDTTDGPVLVKPRRQPMHLEEKITEALKNLEENGIIKNVIHSGILH